ncbi:hypothetical protein [Roseimicrobium sp. ORNL1]|uniref:hypothetical protein n=1 Tax=Roseimicrobium sp. ORNL1 TaxID=2711231 RepID=UPI0013E1D234|nr:hypothetical protein [Roseimicrobium sp. ORNL1]QIF02098.1 hypothetical protein G5S37_11325 [Roseimicrobium sp. ORNL1]
MMSSDTLLLAYIVFIPFWAVVTLGAYGGLIIGLFARYWTDIDRSELPGLLRGTSNFGLVSMGSIVAMFGLEISFRLSWDGRINLTSIMQWIDGIAVGASQLAGFAAITSVPTTWCLIWGAILRGKRL